MPPRVMKRAPGPGNKRAARGKVAAAAAEAEKLEEVEVKEEVRVVEEKPSVTEAEEKESEAEEEEDDASVENDDDTKEPIDEYEKDERLDLDDNDTEYEPEEDIGVDYDDRETEHDPLEERDEVEEEPEEADVGEDEEDQEEMESAAEELEPEEDDERTGEEHTEGVDAAEEDEHHEMVKERLKRKEFEVFVGGLDKDATEKDLREVFKEVGEITEVRLLMNAQTKKNKGFAFLRFATVEQARRACVQLKNPVVCGKQCGVSPSRDSDTLFVGNICRTWTKEALKEKLKHYGVDNIEDLTLVEDSNNVGMNRGFAFLEFSSRSDAMDTFKRLQKRDVTFGVDRPAKVSFADSFIDPGDEIMAQVKTVFLDGISASWNEDHVKELLKTYGDIEKVELARNMPSAKRKDFGFVTFYTHDAAVTCAKGINNQELGERDNKAKVRARLSRPLQRDKGKHIARRDSRPGRGSSRGGRSSWSRPLSRGAPRGPKGIGPRHPPSMDRSLRRPVSIRERRPFTAAPSRSRPVAPLPRAYDRRPPVPAYPRNTSKMDYDHREELYPRSRDAAGISSRVPSVRHPSYRDDYAPRESGYTNFPRGGASRSSARRGYADDGYGQRYERPPPTYQESRGREYDSLSGSKRPYASMDDIPPRYPEAVHHSRARLDYDLRGNTSRYADSYDDRLGRSNLGYGGSGGRSTMPSQDSLTLYGGRRDMGYSGGGSYANDVRGYPPSFGSDYMSRAGDVGGSTYSQLYPRRGLGGNSYTGGSSSGSYY